MELGVNSLNISFNSSIGLNSSVKEETSVNFIGIIFYSLIFLIGLFGNSLVIYVVIKFSKMRTVTNTYILNLAIADELFLIGLPLLIITINFKNWIFGTTLCKIYMTITSMNQFASSLLLVLMSQSRFIAVCYPLSSRRSQTLFKSKIMCLIAWIVSIALVIPMYIYSDTYHTEFGTSNCNIFWPKNSLINGMQAFTIYSFTLGFCVPILLIVFFNICIILRLQSRRPKNSSNNQKSNSKKITILLITLICVYVICWLPYWLAQIYITFFQSNEITKTLKNSIIIFGCLSYGNSAVNPILYVFLSKNFRKSFRKTFHCS